jgi:hypothetical protein
MAVGMAHYGRPAAITKIHDKKHLTRMAMCVSIRG